MLLKRDRDFLIGKAIENFGMGIGMALIFLQLAAFPSGTNGSDQVAKFFLAGCPGNYNKEVSDSYQKFLAGTYGSIFLTSFHILLGTLTLQLLLLALKIVPIGLPFYFIAGLAHEPTAFFIFIAILICERSVRARSIMRGLPSHSVFLSKLRVQS